MRFPQRHEQTQWAVSPKGLPNPAVGCTVALLKQQMAPAGYLRVRARRPQGVPDRGRVGQE
jgi:hypothetical protein